MGRRPLIRETILRVLSGKQPMRFKEIAEALKNALNRKKVNPKSLASALDHLQKQGYVEKTLDNNGNIVYTLTSNFFEAQLKNTLQKLVSNAGSLDFFHDLYGDNPPAFAFIKIPELRKESSNKIYFYPEVAGLSHPSNIAAAIMADTLDSYGDHVWNGVRKLIATAYWCGVQSEIANFGVKPLREVIQECKAFAEECIRKFEVDSKRMEAERAVIRILDITEGLVANDNLYDFLIYLKENDSEMKQLQRRIEQLTGRDFLGAGERIWDVFLDFHHCILTGLKHAHKNFNNFWLVNHRDVWNVFFSYFLAEPADDFKEIKAESQAVLQQYVKEFFQYLERLPWESRAVIIYVWGFPEIVECSEKTCLKDFQEWLTALKNGELDHHNHLFTEETKQKILKFYRLTRNGKTKKLPEAVFIEPAPWSLRDLYQYHPRGKDPEFWLQLLRLLEERATQRKTI